MSVLRLLIFGTRRGWGRLAGIIAGVAIGVVLALLLIAGAHALEARDIRGAWLQPSVEDIALATPSDTIAATSSDGFEGRRIQRLDLAVPSTSAAQPPGLPVLEPGTYLASPALQALIDATPRNQLGDRYGTSAGLIPADLLASPDTLAVVVGGTRAEVQALASAGSVGSFDGAAYGGNQSYQTLAFIGALALLIPAFLLVAVSTTLGAAARAERWQTLLTIGAPRRLVTRIAVVEAACTAAIGCVLGVGGFFALRPALALLRVDGLRLVASDLSVPVGAILLIALVVLLGAILAASRSARRIGTATTATSVAERTPSPWRIVPLALGIAAFLVLNAYGRSFPLPLEYPVIGCFVVLALGLLVVGPWLTWATGRIFERSSGSGSGVIASRRIVRSPRAGFRSVAGLVAATFLITVFAFANSAQVNAGDYMSQALLAPGAVAARVEQGSSLSPRSTTTALEQVPGVLAVYYTHTDGEQVYLAGADVAALTGKAFADRFASVIGGVYSLAPEGPPVKGAAVASLDGMPVGDVIVVTDGSQAAIEGARTELLLLAGIDTSAGAWQRAEAVESTDSDLATQFAEIGRLAIVIVTALAAAVLAISTIAALYDRKRTFGLLQLIGMPGSALRKVISWETLIPLLSIIVPAIALGWFTAFMLITTLSQRTVGWPDSLLPLSLLATALMALASIGIASRVGLRLARASENTHHE